jgi:hypothetical protein
MAPYGVGPRPYFGNLVNIDWLMGIFIGTYKCGVAPLYRIHLELVTTQVKQQTVTYHAPMYLMYIW